MGRHKQSFPTYLLPFTFLVLLLGYLIKYLVYPDLRIGTGRTLSLMFAMIPAIFTTILFHETGHVLSGTFAGLKFSWMSVGKVQLYLNTHQQLKLRIVKHLPMFGGYASMYTNNEHLLRWRHIFFVMGGALGNVLLFLLIIFSYKYTPPGGFLRVTMIVTALTSLVTSVLTFIPYRTRGVATDGLHIIHFLTGGVQMRRTIAMTLLYGSTMEGLSVKSWKSEWIKDVLSVRDNSAVEALGNLYTHNWALNKKDTEAAENHIDRAVELSDKLDPATATVVYWAKAYHSAICKNDAVEARAMFDKAGSNPLAPAYYPLRTEAAVLFAEGHFEEAKTKAAEGIKIYRELGSPQYGQEELEQLEDILAKSENALASSSSMVT
jgi:lipoprotein signal peptidase